MVHIREFEELCSTAFRQGTHGIGGYLHLYSGEEAIAVGIIGAMDIAKGDAFIGHYRDHAYALAAGSPPGQVMGRNFAVKPPDAAKARAVPCTSATRNSAFTAATASLAAMFLSPLVWRGRSNTGGATRSRFASFGDGSMNQGGFHETLNMAQLYKVPVLFVVENNGYAMGTSIERSHANPNLCDRITSYNMKREKVDGQNVVTLHERVTEIIAEMRETKEPFFLECETYRYHGHGAADTKVTQSTYRSEDEVEQWRTTRDPINILQKILMDQGALTEEEHGRINQEAVEAAEAALKFSDESPDPTPDELLKDVYA